MQYEVRVKVKNTGEETTITYHAYKDSSQYYELIGEIDRDGNLVPGNPNLLPQHQKQKAENVAPVVSAGISMEDKLKMKEELTSKFSRTVVEEKIPAKRGPKPKIVQNEA